MSVEWFLTLLWKSSLLCGGVLLLLRLARHHSPAQRARVALAGMTLLASLPVLALLLPPLQIGVLPSVPEVAPQMRVALAQAPAAVAIGTPQPVSPRLSILSQDECVLLLWLAGSAALLAHLACGIMTLRRWTCAGTQVRSRAWANALHRAGASEVQLLVSDDVQAPLSWGLFRPTILLSHDLVADVADADAVVAHEVAHIRRRDWAALLFSRFVVALYWFNPLVWLLERAMLHEAEEAADAEAMRIVQPVRYAETLLKVASTAQVPIAANSIAAGALGKRMTRILHGEHRYAAARWAVVAIYVALGLSAPVAALELVPAASPVPPEAEGAPRLRPSMLTLMPALAASAHVEAAAQTGSPPSDPSDVHAPTGELDAAVAQAQEQAETSARHAKERAHKAVEQAERARGRALQAQQQFLQQRQPELQLRLEQMSTRLAEVGERTREAVARSMATMAVSMANGAAGMERGADGMVRGAQSMRDEAGRLKDPAYRQRKIAEAASRGEHVTDQELIDSIPQLQKGADEMVRGAEEMRRGAQQMRQSAHGQE